MRSVVERRLRRGSVLFGLAALAACGTSEGDTYTLYRRGVLSPELRVHVATFDAKNDGKANRETAKLPAIYSQSNPV